MIRNPSQELVENRGFGYARALRPVTLILSARDEEGGSGLARIMYLLSGEDTWHEYSGPISITTDGPNYILYYAVDNDGNTGPFNVAYANIDRDVPVSDITSPLEGESCTGEVTITGMSPGTQN